MGVPSITYKKFLDRLMRFDELEKLADMLRRWYLLRAGSHGASGHVTAEAEVYAFPRPQADAVRAALAQRAPTSTSDTTDPDVARTTGPATPANSACDLSTWQAALAASEPNVCVQLRLTIAGP